MAKLSDIAVADLVWRVNVPSTVTPFADGAPIPTDHKVNDGWFSAGWTVVADLDGNPAVQGEPGATIRLPDSISRTLTRPAAQTVHIVLAAEWSSSPTPLRLYTETTAVGEHAIDLVPDDAIPGHWHPVFSAGAEEVVASSRAFAAGAPVVLSLVNDGTGTDAYVNGALVGELPAMPARSDVVVVLGDESAASGTIALITAFQVKAAHSSAQIEGFVVGYGVDPRGQVSLTWEPPEHDGGLPLLGYEVRALVDGRVEHLDVDADATGALVALPCEPTHVQVVAVNAVGGSTPVEGVV